MDLSHAFLLSPLVCVRMRVRVCVGVFALLQAYAFLQYVKDKLTRQERQSLFYLGVSAAALAVFLTVIYLSCIGESRTCYASPLPPVLQQCPLEGEGRPL